ncbi:MAG: AraC family transcriptional regulator, partial [Clostridia bacterium]|nr:AraC family transcriptional regulator [Clostridia bacterium]
MKNKMVARSPSPRLRLHFFGYEEIGELAKWGPGRRNHYIVQYVLRGEGYYNGRLVKTGQGFVMRPGEAVEYHPDAEDPWQYFFMTFSGEICDELCQTYFCPDENGIFSFGFHKELTEYADRLFPVENERGTLSVEEGLSVFFHLLALHGVERPKGGSNRYVEEAKNYIRLNFHRPLSISEVALSLNITDRYLYNLFIK